ncbi:tetratricopeptide repeat protein [Hyalangium versicolor]|uniref:tetratricopeptide repeat protein n=1 Tax=Hyalangium versicolor TaxID=2861190 RepID=UPI001CCFD2FE|nr:tetratricopeptide repeat protein [Hyalangium versicolor]
MATTRATGQESGPVDDEFLHLLYQGGELLAAGKLIEAKDFLERAHQLQPKNEKGQNLLGLAYFKLGQFDRAAELYEMLVRDNPVDPTLRVNLGLVYLKTNALQRAVREFEVAVDLAPDHKKAHNYLGLALAQQSEYGRAREHFIQAGSDAMAEKMGRAIEGEGYSRAPSPAQPVKARGSAEGAEEGRGQGGGPTHETPPPTGADLVIDVVEEPPAQQAAAEQSGVSSTPVPVPEEPPAQAAEDDWGAQFGLDDSSQQGAVPAQEASPEEVAPSAEAAMAAEEAPPPAPESEYSGAEGPVMAASNAAAGQGTDFAISVDEEPGIPMAEIAETAPVPAPNLPMLSVEDVSEDGMPVLTAEPENPEDLAAIAQHEETPGGQTEEFAVPANALESVPEAAVEEVPSIETTEFALPEAALESAPEAAVEAVPPPLPVSEVEGAVLASPETAEILEAHPEQLAGVEPAVPTPPPMPLAAVSGGTGQQAWRGGAVPVLGELALGVELGGASAESPFTVGASGFSARVEGELLTRLDGLVAFTGSLAFKPEMKRFRGRTTDKPFGEGSARVVRATGRGVLFIEPAEQRTFHAVDLGDESAYFRDECLFAFEEPVMFENGRVPSEVAPDLDLVHLRGNGKVLLSLSGPLRSVRVGMEAAVTVPLAYLVGWQGNLTPKVVSLLEGVGGEVLKTAVELSGEGFALISLPVR